MKRELISNLVNSFNGDLDRNVQAICQHRTFLQECQVPMLSFKIGDEEKVKVSEGKYKTALLLWTLYDLAEIKSGCRINILDHPIRIIRTFYYTTQMQEIVRRFYGEELCSDSENHPSLKALLGVKNLWIRLDMVNLFQLDLLFDILLEWKNDENEKEKRIYFSEPLVREAMEIARTLVFRGTISQWHPFFWQRV